MTEPLFTAAKFRERNEASDFGYEEAARIANDILGEAARELFSTLTGISSNVRGDYMVPPGTPLTFPPLPWSMSSPLAPMGGENILAAFGKVKEAVERQENAEIKARNEKTS